MSTNASITLMIDHGNTKEAVVTLFKFYDGYPTVGGIGVRIAKWLCNMTIINGIGEGCRNNDTMANGVGCLFAKLIHDFKNETGDLYITSLYTQCFYNYYITVKEDEPGSADLCTTMQVVVEGDGIISGKTLFEGRPSEYIEYFLEEKLEESEKITDKDYDKNMTGEEFIETVNKELSQLRDDIKDDREYASKAYDIINKRLGIPKEIVWKPWNNNTL